MKPLLRWTLAFSLLLFLNCAAQAQNQPPSPCAAGNHAFGSLGVTASTGCPFSATAEILRTKTLADGTRIQTRAKSLVYRDSYGRVAYYTYQPVGLNEPDPNSPNFIQILDPVAGYAYFLLPQSSSHVATRHSLAPPLPAAEANVSRPAPSDPSRPQPKFTREQLGTQDMLGFLVTGERMTTIYSAGTEHSDRPITVVSETWRSPEMGLVFLRKTSDPSNADDEFRVTSFAQSEPDAAVFQIPAGYTIQDQKPR